jgi:hypothetical protein
MERRRRVDVDVMVVAATCWFLAVGAKVEDAAPRCQPDSEPRVIALVISSAAPGRAESLIDAVRAQTQDLPIRLTTDLVASEPRDADSLLAVLRAAAQRTCATVVFYAEQPGLERLHTYQAERRGERTAVRRLGDDELSLAGRLDAAALIVRSTVEAALAMPAVNESPTAVSAVEVEAVQDIRPVPATPRFAVELAGGGVTLAERTPATLLVQLAAAAPIGGPAQLRVAYRVEPLRRAETASSTTSSTSHAVALSLGYQYRLDGWSLRLSAGALAERLAYSTVAKNTWTEAAPPATAWSMRPIIEATGAWHVTEPFAVLVGLSAEAYLSRQRFVIVSGDTTKTAAALWPVRAAVLVGFGASFSVGS